MESVSFRRLKKGDRTVLFRFIFEMAKNKTKPKSKYSHFRIKYYNSFKVNQTDLALLDNEEP